MVKKLFNIIIVTEVPLQYTATLTLDALKHIQNVKKCNQKGILSTNLYSSAHLKMILYMINDGKF